MVTIISSEVIGARIRELRREKELTQQELAEFCSFPGSWKISGLESGRKGSGIERPDTLEIVCRELGIELWELLKPDPPLPKSTTADNISPAGRQIIDQYLAPAYHLGAELVDLIYHSIRKPEEIRYIGAYGTLIIWIYLLIIFQLLYILAVRQAIVPERQLLYLENCIIVRRTKNNRCREAHEKRVSERLIATHFL